MSDWKTIGKDCWNIILDYKMDLECAKREAVSRHLLNREFQTLWDQKCIFLMSPDGDRMIFLSIHIPMLFGNRLSTLEIIYKKRMSRHTYDIQKFVFSLNSSSN